MSSIPPLSHLSRLLLSNDTTIKVEGKLGHRKVRFTKNSKAETYPLTQVLSAIKDERTNPYSPQRKTLNQRVKAIKDSCKGTRSNKSLLRYISNINPGICNNLLTKETEQQVKEINEEKISLFDYFDSPDDVDINDLLRLAPHLDYVDLSGIEEKIEDLVEGGMNTFLAHLS